MSFLDHLKQQSGQLQARQGHDEQALAQRTQAVEAAAATVQRYLRELATHLNVIRPPSSVTYVLDRRVVLQGVPMADFRYDARRRILRDQELIDHVVMSCSLQDGRSVQLSLDFINEIEALEKRLEQAATAFEREAVRNPANGKLIEMRYAFKAEVQRSVRVTCRHDDGLLHFALRNLDGLEAVDCDFPPELVTAARLDELARWWVGQPHGFLSGALGLRRTEAR